MQAPVQKKVFTERIKEKRPPGFNLGIRTNTTSATLSTPDLKKALQTPDLDRILTSNLNDLSSDSTQRQAATIKQDPDSVSEQETINLSTSPPVAMNSGNETQVINQTDQHLSSSSQNAIPMMTTFAVVQDRNTNLPIVPVDLEKQEEEKVERKRERNRIAATKCRKRKIERINILEEEVKMLNEKMSEHMNTKRKLQIEIDELRNRIRAHVKQGCKNLEEYLVDTP
ncbi:Oidioi.mRNA.OKI2018_I69.chr1.g3887.t1.cds [Oikopleura dioica]|uniref:Oidioi.mRNA.OKI2018_I69.chr1.g3887.t1.cds n=1 Tax=Oikopleura dioica TaxID=34765 RepID=A0ABN7T214_OIKDI|nr:Oidioi.mRNA.OKI2018_I69.chr1.g3887.t1.cds [Oikopleura dioica]